MAEEFPHVKFNALDIGESSVTRHAMVVRLETPMQPRLPRGLRPRT